MKLAAIVLNWNDAELLNSSVGSLLKQTLKCDVVVVDNASNDNSREVIKTLGNKVIPLWNKDNLGFAGGINTGIKYAIKNKYDYVALLNNDAIADKKWLSELVNVAESSKLIGAVTSTMLHKGDNTYDSTGDFYTIWGLPFPRGRDETVKGQYDGKVSIMSASGGASIFRTDMLKEVGLFDEDFFAYYEDSDLGMRANLKGWEFKYAPKAIVIHDTGSTSSRVKNFTTYQTLKNLPLLVTKNVPLALLPMVLPRFLLAYSLFTLRAITRGQMLTVLRAWLILVWLIPKKLTERKFIQKNSTKEGRLQFKKLLVRDLPSNAAALKRFRNIVRKVWPSFV